jgi:energy-coupling factor transport system ATP-binding protein
MLRKAESRVETVVIASHDLQLVAAWADRVIVMGEGEVLADAPPVEVFADPDLLAATGLRQPQVVELSERVGVDPPALTAEAMVETLRETVESDALADGGVGGEPSSGGRDER